MKRQAIESPGAGPVLPMSDTGHGEPAVVLLHSFGSGRGEWRECAKLLESRHRCVAFDLPGFGEAARFTGYAIHKMADAVLETTRTLGVGSIVLAGHSMSGKVAMAIAARRPAGLAGLILVTPSPPSPEPIPDDARRRMLAMARSRSCAEEFIDRITATPLIGAVRERAIADFIACSPAAWVAWLECGSNEDCTGDIGTIDCPTLVIAGALDPALPAAVQRKWTLPHLANAELREIANCGHLPMLEHPGALCGLMAEFIRRRVDAPVESSS